MPSSLPDCLAVFFPACLPACLVFQVHVLRLLRSRMDKPAVKAGKAVASVSLAELAVSFDGMSLSHTRDAMERLLRDE